METIEKIKQHFNDSIHTKIMAADTLVEAIRQASEILVQSLLSNNKILTCGNGGSAANAQHFAEIMLNRFDTERPSLPAIALSTGSITLTSIADDFHYADIFAKQIEAFGQQNDVLILFSPHGNSKNILDAIETAHQRQLHVVALTGGDGGEVTTLLNPNTDVEIRVPSASSARIQETHLLITHCLCDAIDQSLFATEEPSS
ncbi:MAG: phosphoheptose isomerase [Coxiella sp. RIFCSPHIGHO2_12_FULL_42_15]|nr:MAG: phosphoheptose isomerase [Coxiella sp. RIFCSPHIGHO2_12_FULL_42_15]